MNVFVWFNWGSFSLLVLTNLIYLGVLFLIWRLIAHKSFIKSNALVGVTKFIVCFSSVVVETIRINDLNSQVTANFLRKLNLKQNVEEALLFLNLTLVNISLLLLGQILTTAYLWWIISIDVTQFKSNK